ncbi:TPA: hypothetical protein ACOKUG_001825 [Streptococcus pneumoniae]
MKSFKDFRESLTAEDMQAISAKANEATKQIDHTTGEGQWFDFCNNYY